MKIISLLERIYQRQLPLLQDEEAYQVVLEEIELQSIAGPVYQTLKEHDLLHQVPLFFRKALRESRDAASLFNMILNSEADKIIRQLELNGVKTIVLKGVWLSRRLYGSIGVRRTTDIDLLVQPEDVAAAAEVLADFKFKSLAYESYGPYHTLYVKQIPYVTQTIKVELHWDLLKTDFCRLDCGQLWDNSLPLESYAHIHELSIPYLFYTLCLHGAKHVMSSVKYLLDLVVMLHRHKDEIDYKLLLERARREHTFGMVVMALSVTYRLFPHLNTVKPFEQCRNWFPWDQKLALKRESEFKQFKGIPFYFQQTVFELAKLDQHRYRLKYLQRLMFPHNGEMRTYLNLPESTPGWKLYLRWHGRFFKANKRRHQAGSA